MKCPKTGGEHQDYDFDGNGESTSGCDCVDLSQAEDLTLTPTLDAPEGEESYENPQGDGDVDESLWVALNNAIGPERGNG